MRKIFFLILFLVFFPRAIFAFCPICTVAMGTGVGLCRYLGIDDLISGTWIGGFLMSLTLWIIDWLNKKKIKFLFRKPLILIFLYALVIFPLAKMKIIGHPENKFFGIDKLLFGMISGSIVFLISFLLNNFVIKMNKEKVFFPFQKVAIPLVALIILSLIFYLTC